MNVNYHKLTKQCTCSFICEGTLTRSHQSDLCGLRVKLPPITNSLTKIEKIQLSAPPKDITSKLASLSSH